MKKIGHRKHLNYWDLGCRWTEIQESFQLTRILDKSLPSSPGCPFELSGDPLRPKKCQKYLKRYNRYAHAGYVYTVRLVDLQLQISAPTLVEGLCELLLCELLLKRPAAERQPRYSLKYVSTPDVDVSQPLLAVNFGGSLVDLRLILHATSRDIGASYQAEYESLTRAVGRLSYAKL